MPNRVKGADADSDPKDGDERAERDDRVEQAEPESQTPFDEQLDVFGNALVGVVGGIAEQLHAVVVGVVEPVAEIGPGHPVRQRICSHWLR